MRIESFKPVVDKKSRVLILGSMPGEESIRKQQYYAHPRNLFWPLIYEIFDRKPETDYRYRVRFLRDHHIALWDVFKTCSREGSLDSRIRDETPNDIAGLLKAYPDIRAVFCNGGTAERQFRTKELPKMKRSLLYTRIFSTSPANASISYPKKLEDWVRIRHVLENRVLCRTALKTTFGEISIYSNGLEITGIALPGGHFPAGNHAVFPGDALGEKAKEQLQDYLNGARKEFSIPVKTAGTPFQERVYHALSRIPYGKTVSYGELAGTAGSRNAARAVGQAVRRNPVPIIIPCHRVIGSGGKTVGFMGVRNNPLQNVLLRLEQEHR